MRRPRTSRMQQSGLLMRARWQMGRPLLQRLPQRPRACISSALTRAAASIGQSSRAGGMAASWCAVSTTHGEGWGRSAGTRHTCGAADTHGEHIAHTLSLAIQSQKKLFLQNIYKKAAQPGQNGDNDAPRIQTLPWRRWSVDSPTWAFPQPCTGRSRK